MNTALRVVGVLVAAAAAWFISQHTIPPPLPSRGMYATAAHPALGCWEVNPSAPVYRYLINPARIELFADTTAWRGRARLNLANAVPRPSIIRIEYWVPLNGDRIYLFWGDGLTGIGLVLTQRGDTLRGRTILTSDVGWPRRGPRALGQRVSCGDSGTRDTIPS